MSICRSLLVLHSKEIMLVNGEVELPRDVEPLILAAPAQGARVLRKRKLIVPVRTILYGDGYCLLRVAAR